MDLNSLNNSQGELSSQGSSAMDYEDAPSEKGTKRKASSSHTGRKSKRTKTDSDPPQMNYITPDYIKECRKKAAEFRQAIMGVLGRKASETLFPEKSNQDLILADAIKDNEETGLNFGIVGATNSGKTYITSALLRSLVLHPWRTDVSTSFLTDIQQAKTLSPEQKDRVEDFPCRPSKTATEQTAASLLPKLYHYSSSVVKLEIWLTTLEEYRFNSNTLDTNQCETTYTALKDQFLNANKSFKEENNKIVLHEETLTEHDNVFDSFARVWKSVFNFEVQLVDQPQFQPLVSHFNYVAPFGLPNNWKLYEFPGFGDENAVRKRNTLRLMSQLDCVLLTTHARNLEPGDFNCLESLMKEKTPRETMPQLIVLDNTFKTDSPCSENDMISAVGDSAQNLAYIKDRINAWKVSDNNQNITVCGSIEGSKRVALFDEIQQQCDHYIFFSSKKLGNCTSPVLQPYKKHTLLFDILQRMLNYKLHRLLRQAFHYIRSVFFRMKSFVTRPPKMQKSDKAVDTTKITSVFKKLDESQPNYVDYALYEQLLPDDEELPLDMKVPLNTITQPLSTVKQETKELMTSDTVRQCLHSFLDCIFELKAKAAYLKCHTYSGWRHSYSVEDPTNNVEERWNDTDLQNEFEEVFSSLTALKTLEDTVKGNESNSNNTKIDKRKDITASLFESMVVPLKDKLVYYKKHIDSLDLIHTSTIAKAICKDLDQAFKTDLDATAIELLGAQLKKLPSRRLRCKGGFDSIARSILKGTVFDEELKTGEKLMFADISADEKELNEIKNQITNYISKNMRIDGYDPKFELVTTSSTGISKYMPVPPKMMEYKELDADGKQNLLKKSKAKTSKLPTEKLCDCHKNMKTLNNVDQDTILPPHLTDLGYTKLISIEHSGSALQENDVFSGFKIHCYPQWLDDLKDCLQRNGSVVYIPTKGRSKPGRQQAKIVYNKHNLMEVSATSQGLPYIVYAFVEQQELNEYIENFRTEDPNNLVFVSIPGRDRGVWFARSLILILQRQQQAQLAAQKTPFDYWWMNDDDIMEVRAFDRETKIDCMHPCSLGLAMMYAEQALKHHINKNDERYEVDDYGGKILSGWARRNLEGCFAAVDNDAWIDTSDEERNSKINALHDELLFPKEQFNYQRFGWANNQNATNAVANLYKKWIEKSGDATQRVAQMALCPRNTTSRHNYNILDGKGYQYRVSDQRHAFILFNSRAFEGYAYYSWDQLMWSQAKVDKEIEAAKKTTDEVNSFLGEDKVIVQRLAADGRAGLLLYCFDVKSPAPISSQGGCRKFRTFKENKRRYRDFTIEHACGKPNNVKHTK